MRAYELRRVFSGCARFVFALVCLSGLGLAHAQSSVHVWPGAVAISNGYVFSYDASSGTYRPDTQRTYGPGSANAVTVRDPVRLNSPGPGAVVDVTRTVPWASTARAVGSAAFRALPWIYTAVAVCDLLNSAGVDCPPGSGGPQMDPGTQPQTQTVNGYYLGAYGCGANGSTYAGVGEVLAAGIDCATQPPCTPSPSSFCQYDVWANGVSGSNGSCTSTSSCTIYGQRTRYIVQGSNRLAQGYQNSTTVSHASTGFIWGRQNIETTSCPPYQFGEIPEPYADGTCPTEVRIQPTEVQLQDAITVRGVPYNVVEVVERLVENNQPVEAPEPAVITGPASVVGSTTTTTSPEGTSTRTVEYMFDYGPDRVTWGRVETGVSTSGETTTTTTTGTDNAAEGTGLCELYPDILACAKIGDPPEDEIPTDTRNVDFEEVDLGGASGCPAAIDLGDGKSFSYQPLCDQLTMVRPLIIAVGLVLAGLIVVNALKA